MWSHRLQESPLFAVPFLQEELDIRGCLSYRSSTSRNCFCVFFANLSAPAEAAERWPATPPCEPSLAQLPSLCRLLFSTTMARGVVIPAEGGRQDCRPWGRLHDAGGVAKCGFVRVQTQPSTLTYPSRAMRRNHPAASRAEYSIPPSSQQERIPMTVLARRV